VKVIALEYLGSRLWPISYERLGSKLRVRGIGSGCES